MSSAQDDTAERPSLHISFGGASLPGGTFGLGRKTDAFEFSYEHPNLFDAYGLQIGYRNEGHFSQLRYFFAPATVPVHFRDETFLEINRWSATFAGCRVGAAAGPQMYFDTTTSDYRTHYLNRHGIGLRASVAGQCYLIPTLAVELLAGRSIEVADFNASSVTLGFTYIPHEQVPSATNDFGPSAGADHYVEFVGGQVMLDSFRVHQELGTAFWLTYGQGLENPFAFEVSLLNEHIDTFAGNISRQSLAAQFVVSESFGIPRLHFFAGLGPALSRTDTGVNAACDGVEADCNKLTQERYTQINLLYELGLRVGIGSSVSMVVKVGRMAASSSTTDTDIISGGFRVNFR